MTPVHPKPTPAAARRSWLLALVLGATGLLAPPLAAAPAYDPQQFVAARAGSMPVILAVPHDGGERLPGVPERSGGVRVRDTSTQLLATRTADAIERQTGRRPYVVVARFSRRFVDANRSADEAVESPDALPAWQAYHAQLADFVAQVRERWPGGGLLVDVHGQGVDPSTVFRGTRNGRSVQALVQRHGREAIDGEASLLGVLRARGHGAEPAPGAREVRFNGGNTVEAYGSHHSEGIDTIQLEFGKSLRESEEAAQDLAEAILVFEKAYLAGPASAGTSSGAGK
jgi:N-formylglutamate amidohydrolase